MDQEPGLLKHVASHFFFARMVIILVVHGLVTLSSASSENGSAATEPAPAETVSIERLSPERGSGQGYRMVYHVDVPIAAFWKWPNERISVLSIFKVIASGSTLFQSKGDGWRVFTFSRHRLMDSIKELLGAGR